MVLKHKTIGIGTTSLALAVCYSDLKDALPENQDGEIVLSMRRINSGVWQEEELEGILRDAARGLVDRGILPLQVRAFVDDRYNELSNEQMKRFQDYCNGARDVSLSQ